MRIRCAYISHVIKEGGARKKMESTRYLAVLLTLYLSSETTCLNNGELYPLSQVVMQQSLSLRTLAITVSLHPLTGRPRAGLGKYCLTADAAVD